MNRNRVLRVMKILVMIAVAFVAFGFVTMQLWNWLMPAIFGLRLITFGQAVGLVVLSKILLGGFTPRPGGRRGWKGHMEERWANMSAEERDRMRSGMRGRWGCGIERPSEPAAEQRQG